MTEEERIKWNLRQLARVASDKDYYREWGAKAVVHYIRNVLGRIEELLELEPESLASSVLRLTDICNELGRENAILHNDLTDMTLNYNAAEKHARQLSRAFEKDLARKDGELDAAISSNVWLRERLTFKDQSLRACRAAEKVLKHNLEQASWDATKLKRELALREQCLTRIQSRLERIKLGLESRSVEEKNRKLKRELASKSTCLRRIRDQLERILEHTEP